MENVENIYPLSPAQEGMLFHTLAEPGSGVYVEQLSCRLEGALNLEQFEKAWQATINEHASLRTAFLWDGLDQPLQVVHERLDAPVTLIKESTADTVSEFLAEDRRRGFDLTAAPCLRLTLFSESPSRHTFVWSFHHLISDGWSTPRLLREVFARLGNKPIAPSKSRPFHEYIAWLQQQDLSSEESFWKEHLAGFEEPLRLPILQPSAGDTSYDQIETRLTARESAALEERCRRLRITPNTLVLGAWALTLARYTQRSDVVCGMTVSGRPPSLPGVETMIGNFINSLPVRIPVGEEVSIEEWFTSIQTTQDALRDHEHSSLAKVQGWSDCPPGDSLFETLFVFENYPADADSLSIPGLSVSDFEYREQSNYPLAAIAVPGQRLRLLFIHDKTQFAPLDAQALLTHWKQAVSQLSSLPLNTRLKVVNVLTPTEETQLLHDWNATDVCLDGPDTVLEAIDQATANNPEAPALALNGVTASYAELDHRVRQWSYKLIEAGFKRGDLAAVVAGRSFEMVIVILAVMRAGGGYIPIDPTYPPERINFLLEDSKARLILSDRDFPHPHLRIDQSIEDAPPETPLPKVSKEDPAYMIYTSGSTGQPRGVLVRQAQLWASTYARHHHYQERVHAFLLLSSFSFDSSVAGIFWTLTQGGCLCLLSDDERTDPIAIAHSIQKHQVTHLLGIPTLVDAFVTAHHRENLGSLKTLIVAGESCPPQVPSRLREILPSVRIYNEYGPTEATVWSTVHECQKGPIRIGKPIANTQVYVLDHGKRLLPVGLAGELYLGGAGITDGYHGDPGLTAERFVANPFQLEREEHLYRTGDRVRYHRDGTLEFLGRMDNQVKHRGHRIELGEIEHALLTHGDVQEACVLLQEAKSPSSSVEDLANVLDALPPDKAMELLASIRPERKLSRQHFEITLDIDGEYINPPRPEQRDWLVSQAMNECADDLEHLHEAAKRFVPGAGVTLKEYDIAHSELSDDQIMEDWQTPIMQAMARQVAGAENHVLEIGFGRGVSATFLQSLDVKSHTIVESNDFSVENHFVPWRKRYPQSDIRLVHARWQDALDQLGLYDGIFFHAFPLNEQEFIDTVVKSITFAEHFFPVAAKLLRPGGSFVYLTTEIDSVSRRHQRALLKHFSTLSISVEKASPPNDTRDTWWADSMVILKAVK